MQWLLSISVRNNDIINAYTEVEVVIKELNSIRGVINRTPICK